MQFGEALEKAIEQAGYSKRRFAKEVGVDKKTIWAWIKGINRPIFYNLKKMAEIFGIDVDNLLEFF